MDLSDELLQDICLIGNEPNDDKFWKNVEGLFKNIKDLPYVLERNFKLKNREDFLKYVDGNISARLTNIVEAVETIHVEKKLVDKKSNFLLLKPVMENNEFQDFFFSYALSNTEIKRDGGNFETLLNDFLGCYQFFNSSDYIENYVDNTILEGDTKEQFRIFYEIVLIMKKFYDTCYYYFQCHEYSKSWNEFCAINRNDLQKFMYCGLNYFFIRFIPFLENMENYSNLFEKMESQMRNRSVLDLLRILSRKTKHLTENTVLKNKKILDFFFGYLILHLRFFRSFCDTAKNYISLLLCVDTWELFGLGIMNKTSPKLVYHLYTQKFSKSIYKMREIEETENDQIFSLWENIEFYVLHWLIKHFRQHKIHLEEQDMLLIIIRRYIKKILLKFPENSLEVEIEEKEEKNTEIKKKSGNYYIGGEYLKSFVITNFLRNRKNWNTLSENYKIMMLKYFYHILRKMGINDATSIKYMKIGKKQKAVKFHSKRFVDAILRKELKTSEECTFKFSEFFENLRIDKFKLYQLLIEIHPNEKFLLDIFPSCVNFKKFLKNREFTEFNNTFIYHNFHNCRTRSIEMYNNSDRIKRLEKDNLELKKDNLSLRKDVSELRKIVNDLISRDGNKKMKKNVRKSPIHSFPSKKQKQKQVRYSSKSEKLREQFSKKREEEELEKEKSREHYSIMNDQGVEIFGLNKNIRDVSKSFSDCPKFDFEKHEKDDAGQYKELLKFRKALKKYREVDGNSFPRKMDFPEYKISEDLDFSESEDSLSNHEEEVDVDVEILKESKIREKQRKDRETGDIEKHGLSYFDYGKLSKIEKKKYNEERKKRQDLRIRRHQEGEFSDELDTEENEEYEDTKNRSIRISPKTEKKTEISGEDKNANNEDSEDGCEEGEDDDFRMEQQNNYDEEFIETHESEVNTKDNKVSKKQKKGKKKKTSPEKSSFYEDVERDRDMKKGKFSAISTGKIRANVGNLRRGEASNIHEEEKKKKEEIIRKEKSQQQQKKKIEEEEDVGEYVNYSKKNPDRPSRDYKEIEAFRENSNDFNFEKTSTVNVNSRNEMNIPRPQDLCENERNSRFYYSRSEDEVKFYPGRSLYLRNISRKCNRENIHRELITCGKIECLHINHDGKWGYIEFQNSDQARSALNNFKRHDLFKLEFAKRCFAMDTALMIRQFPINQVLFGKSSSMTPENVVGSIFKPIVNEILNRKEKERYEKSKSNLRNPKNSEQFENLERKPVDFFDIVIRSVKIHGEVVFLNFYENKCEFWMLQEVADRLDFFEYKKQRIRCFMRYNFDRNKSSPRYAPRFCVRCTFTDNSGIDTRAVKDFFSRYGLIRSCDNKILHNSIGPAIIFIEYFSYHDCIAATVLDGEFIDEFNQKVNIRMEEYIALEIFQRRKITWTLDSHDDRNFGDKFSRGGRGRGGGFNRGGRGGGGGFKRGRGGGFNRGRGGYS